MSAARAHGTVLDRLEHATRARHAVAEADLFRVLDGITVVSFVRFLAATYHFEYAVDARLVRVDELAPSFLAPRLRSGRLGDDLLALARDEHVIDILARPLAVPPFASPVDALGWLYVVERDALHHVALYRALGEPLGDLLPFASRYLTARALDGPQRWRELGAVLARFAVDDERVARVAAAAHAAFALRHDWFAQVG